MTRVAAEKKQSGIVNSDEIILQVELNQAYCYHSTQATWYVTGMQDSYALALVSSAMFDVVFNHTDHPRPIREDSDSV